MSTPMKAATLAALRGSIAKWRAIVEGTGADHGTSNCSLCQMFFDNDELDEEGDIAYCVGCPVYDHTGEDNCRATPFESWAGLVRDQNIIDGRYARDPIARDAAQAELDFLISLLPEGEAP